ncbi:7-carboxy-7-deazaguanine synthase QueE [Hydrogenivirga sp.]
MLRDKVRTARALSVNEIYKSIQGEGLLIGTPSVFVRLQGCNLRCPWCDQPEALEFNKKNTLIIDRLLEEIKGLGIRHVVITGGEPFAHEGLTRLAGALVSEGFSVQVETNGTLWREDMEGLAEELHITCSPKAVARFFVHPKIILYAKELKFVVDSELKEEVLLREEFRRLLCEGRVVLQPEGNKSKFFDKALQLQESLARKGFSLRVLPQMHKLFGLP